jgi:hypothetical protein
MTMQVTKEERQRAARAAGAEQRSDRGSEQGPEQGQLVTLGRAREVLCLDSTEFEVAVQLGEVGVVASRRGQWRVPERDVARWREPDGRPKALLERIRLMSTTEGAEAIGVSRERLVKLTRAGFVLPVRWYVNRYRALVWLYRATELRSFADTNRELLAGRLPATVLDAMEEGEDQRARGWRSRRAGQLVRDAYDAWDEAAVWAALLGPEVTDDAVPDPYERACLRRIRTALPPGRPGMLAGPELIRRLTTADHPEEISLALLALSDALGRARSVSPAPHPAPEPPPPDAEPPYPALGPSRPVSAPVPPPGASRPVTRPAAAHAKPRRGLGRVLRRRRSAAGLPEQALLHDGHQQASVAVEDLAARQPPGAGGDG